MGESGGEKEDLLEVGEGDGDGDGDDEGEFCESTLIEGRWCLGDSKMEHILRTFPLRVLPARLRSGLMEPLRWKARALRSWPWDDGLLSSPATADAVDDGEYAVMERLKTDEGLLLMVRWVVFFPPFPLFV